MPARLSTRLFGISNEGTPRPIQPTSFAEMRALEVQHIEQWICRDPTLLGEELMILSNQFAGFEQTRDRPDVLALDHDGRLVVVEIKRDESGSAQDLQAVRYAAYVSTLTAENVVDLWIRHRGADTSEAGRAAARVALNAFIVGSGRSLDDLNDDFTPRIILAAGRFQFGVTSTALWLRRQYGFDITCVQLTPYAVAGEKVIASTVLIPLPEAAEYEARIREKRDHSSTASTRSLDLDAARRFIASIPPGRWSSYGDVAAAAGSPRAGQPIGTWLLNRGGEVPNVYRVLNRHGEVSEGWRPATPDLPATPADVRERLKGEGVHFDAEDRASQDQRWNAEDWTAARSGADTEPAGARLPSPAGT